jgi:hypothetical protein
MQKQNLNFIFAKIAFSFEKLSQLLSKSAKTIAFSFEKLSQLLSKRSYFRFFA